MIYTTVTNNFTITHLERTCLIRMPSRFTAVENNSFKQLFQQICCSGESVTAASSNSMFEKVIIDLGQTTFVDSAGLVGLCQILRLARETNISLTFLSFSPQIKIVLSLAGLESAFPIEEHANVIIDEVGERQANIQTAVFSQSNRWHNAYSALVA